MVFLISLKKIKKNQEKDANGACSVHEWEGKFHSRQHAHVSFVHVLHKKRNLFQFTKRFMIIYSTKKGGRNPILLQQYGEN